MPSKPVFSALPRPSAKRRSRRVRSIGAGWPIQRSGSSERPTIRPSASISEITPPG
jgi:hypothetical protein